MRFTAAICLATVTTAISVTNRNTLNAHKATKLDEKMGKAFEAEHGLTDSQLDNAIDAKSQKNLEDLTHVQLNDDGFTKGDEQMGEVFEAEHGLTGKQVEGAIDDKSATNLKNLVNK